MATFNTLRVEAPGPQRKEPNLVNVRRDGAKPASLITTDRAFRRQDIVIDVD